MQDMNDNQRFLLALFLSILVATVYMQYYVAPYQQQQLPSVQQQSTPVSGQPTEQARPSELQPLNTQSSVQAEAPAAAVIHPSPGEIKESPAVVIENDKFVMRITHLGARVESILLKGYTLQMGRPDLLDLIHSTQGAPLPLGVRQGNLSDDFTRYELTVDGKPGSASHYSVGSSGLTLEFSGSLKDGRSIRKLFRIKPDSFLFDVEITLSGADRDASPLWLEWSRFISESDAKQRYDQKDFMMLSDQGKLVRMPVSEEKQGVRDLGKGGWVAISDQYFMTALVPVAGNSEISAGRESGVLVSRVQGNDSGGKFKVFAGSKVFEDLEGLGFSLEKSVDMGMFSFLAYPILLLLRLFYSLLGNYGIAIIVLTLVIKLAFLPLTSASFKSMQAMQEIQPEVQALRERIDDPTKLNQELMALYKRRGVNPLGGCLPVMIQIPVFLGLYNALLNAIELRHAPFAMWIQDLSSPERLEIMGVGVPLMILVMGASMLIQQWTTPSAMDPAQKKAFMLMPVVFTAMFIIFPMPSGLVLYWLINNVISIVQQQFLRNRMGIGPLQATLIASVVIFVLGYLVVLI